MSKRFFYLVVVLVFLFNIEVSGQEIAVGKFVENKAIKHLSDISYKRQERVLKFYKKSSVNWLNQYAIVPVNLLSSSIPLLRINPLQNNSYTQNLSFFCRKEWQFEKASTPISMARTNIYCGPNAISTRPMTLSSTTAFRHLLSAKDAGAVSATPIS